MEEKKNAVKEEKVNEVKAEEKVKAVSEIKEGEYEDEYNVSAFDDSESGGAGSSTQKVFTTKYSIQKTPYTMASGEIKDNYAIAFLTSINGTKIKSVLRITPRKKGGSNLQEVMKLIMSTPGEHKLEITKTVNRSDNGTTIIYGMQASCLTDEGVPFICPLEPVGVADKAIWENFKRQLAARGDIE